MCLQLLYLMEMMKNGIRQKNVRLPFIMTTYLSKVAQQMLKPGLSTRLNHTLLGLWFNNAET